MAGDENPRKILAPEILPPPNEDRTGSVRDRTRRRLSALLSVSSVGGVALATSCIYGTVDMMPEPVQCTDQDPSQWGADLFVSANWSGDTIRLRVRPTGAKSLSVDSAVTVTGGTLVTVDGSDAADVIFTLNPVPAGMTVVVDGTLLCGTQAGNWEATLDLSGGSDSGADTAGGIPVTVR